MTDLARLAREASRRARVRADWRRHLTADEACIVRELDYRLSRLRHIEVRLIKERFFFKQQALRRAAQARRQPFLKLENGHG